VSQLIVGLENQFLELDVSVLALSLQLFWSQ